MVDGNRSTRPPQRVHIALWALLLVGTAILSLSNFGSYQLGTYSDDAAYVSLARSLVQADRYGNIIAPGEEPGPAQFPFGYPLLLSPFVMLYPDTPDAMKVLSLVATLANVSLLFWGWPWLSRRSHWWALAVASLYVLARPTIDQTRMVMSEPVFLTFCLAAILLAEQLARGESSRWRGPLLGVALVFVGFTRTVGLVIVISILLYLLLRKKRQAWRPVALSLVTMTGLVALLLVATPIDLEGLMPQRYVAQADRTFVGAFRGLVTPGGPSDVVSSRYVENDPTDGSRRVIVDVLLWDMIRGGVIRHFGRDLRTVLLPLGGGDTEQGIAQYLGIPSLPLVVGFLVSGLVLTGFGRWIHREKLSCFAFCAILYFAFMFLWVWDGPRLLYPIQPQLLYGFLLGIEGVLLLVGLPWPGRQPLSTARNGMMVALVLLLASLSIYQSLRITDSRLHVGDLRTRTSWLNANTPTTAVIMTESPSVDYLWSGRKAVGQPRSLASPDELQEFLVGQEVDYILIAPKIAWQESYIPAYSQGTMNLLPLIESLITQGHLARAYASEHDWIQVFQVLPGE